MPKLSKKDLTHLRKVSSQLPRVFDDSEHTTQIVVQGAKLIEKGIKEIKGEPIIPTKSYVHVYKGREISHFRKLKAFCERGEYDKAQEYINSYAVKQTETTN